MSRGLPPPSQSKVRADCSGSKSIPPHLPFHSLVSLSPGERAEIRVGETQALRPSPRRRRAGGEGEVERERWGRGQEGRGRGSKGEAVARKRQSGPRADNMQNRSQVCLRQSGRGRGCHRKEAGHYFLSHWASFLEGENLLSSHLSGARPQMRTPRAVQRLPADSPMPESIPEAPFSQDAPLSFPVLIQPPTRPEKFPGLTSLCVLLSLESGAPSLSWVHLPSPVSSPVSLTQVSGVGGEGREGGREEIPSPPKGRGSQQRAL